MQNGIATISNILLHGLHNVMAHQNLGLGDHQNCEIATASFNS